MSESRFVNAPEVMRQRYVQLQSAYRAQSDTIQTLSERLAVLEASRKEITRQSQETARGLEQQQQRDQQCIRQQREQILSLEQKIWNKNSAQPSRPYVTFSSQARSGSQERAGLGQPGADTLALYQKISQLEERATQAQRDYHSLLYEHQKLLKQTEAAQKERDAQQINRERAADRLAEAVQELSLPELLELRALVEERIQAKSGCAAFQRQQRAEERQKSSSQYSAVEVAEQQAAERRSVLRSNSAQYQKMQLSGAGTPSRAVAMQQDGRSLVASQLLSTASSDPFREIILELDRTTDRLTSSRAEK